MSDEPSLENMLAKAIDTEPGRNLLSPATKEIGDLLGNLASVVSFYATDNLKSIFGKWARNRFGGGKTIDAADFQHIMPLLPAASMQSNDELQERWAALLEATASHPDDVLPSFGQTLSQLTVAEAKFLVRLLISTSDDTDLYAGRQPGEMGYEELLVIYEVRLARKISNTFGFAVPADDDRDPVLMSQADLVIDDLVRLGIISTRVDAASYGSGDDIDTSTWQLYSLSTYGRKFMAAVTLQAS